MAKPKSTLNSTRAERRKKFSKAIDMETYRKCSGNPIYGANPTRDWPDMKCETCHGTTGEMYQKNGKLYCYYCEENIEGEVEQTYDADKSSKSSECQKEETGSELCDVQTPQTQVGT